jgi:hypothetical protein
MERDWDWQTRLEAWRINLLGEKQVFEMQLR